MAVNWGAMGASDAEPPAGRGPSERERLMATAEHHLRAGSYTAAAEVYETLRAADPAGAAVLDALLVDLYIKSAQPEKAMARARAQMARTPDPQAYLAGVYARLNRVPEAVALVERELSGETNPVRRFALRAQLVRLHEQAGDTQAALETARAGHQEVVGTPMESAARRAWDRYLLEQTPESVAP